MGSLSNTLMTAVKITNVLHLDSAIYVILGAFIIAALGYLFGDIKIKGISLGTAGVFLVAIAIGCLFSIKGLSKIDGLSGFYLSKADDAKTNGLSLFSDISLYKFIQNIGLVLFVTAVGFIAGPRFFRDLKKNAHSYVLLGIVIAVTGILIAIAFSFIPGIGVDFSAGILSGALTSTPAFSAAKAAADDSTMVALGSAIAYPFGVVGVVLFVQVMPKILKIDKQRELELMHAPAQRKARKNRKGKNNTEDNNVQEENTVCESVQVQENVETQSENSIQTKALDCESLIDENVDENQEQEYVTFKSKTRKKLFSIDALGFAAFAIAIVFGIALGSLSIPLSSKGYGGATFSLGNTGGPLIIALILGHFGHVGVISFKIPDKTLKEFRELGLMLFLIGAGVEGGNSLVQRIGAGNFDPMIILYGFLGGIAMTLIPMIVGFVVAKFVLKIPLFNNLGSVTGGMTSTPALGALISSTGTEDVANAYAATYPIALVMVVLGCNLMVSLL